MYLLKGMSFFLPIWNSSFELCLQARLPNLFQGWDECLMQFLSFFIVHKKSVLWSSHSNGHQNSILFVIWSLKNTIKNQIRCWMSEYELIAQWLKTSRNVSFHFRQKFTRTYFLQFWHENSNIVWINKWMRHFW